ncbi:sensor histidine kinase [Nocardia sp. CA-119907]|uniref:sensor histidine kinase n=1 Tax=Nocardia sp. CA-119907 TaxID=3239973 RepID=UPI003D971D9F
MGVTVSAGSVRRGLRVQRRWTLRTRLLVTVILIAALGMGAFGALSMAFLERAQLDRVDAQLNLVAAELASTNRPPSPPLGPTNELQVPSEFRLMFFDPAGKPIGTLGSAIGDSTVPRLPPMDESSVGARGSAAFTVADETTGVRWRVRTEVQLPVPNQPDGGTAAVAMSLDTSLATAAKLRNIEVAVGAGLMLAVAAIAAVLVRLELRPLRRIEHTAEAIAAGDLDRRVRQTDPHTEVGRLGAAFNVMVTRLASALRQVRDSEQRMREFIANASHELRTPLTSVRGYSELYRHGGARTEERTRELMSRIEAEAIRMGRLVDDLLLLARFDEERPLDLTEVDLAAVATDVVRDASTRAPDRRITLDATDEPIRILGDVDRIRQIATNLVNNALTHTPSDADITVTVGIDRADAPGRMVAVEVGTDTTGAAAYAVLEVADDGPGVEETIAPRLFDRFYQAGESRSRAGGSGLGLAIVAALATAHQARVQLLADTGTGAVFRVLFPLP